MKKFMKYAAIFLSFITTLNLFCPYVYASSNETTSNNTAITYQIEDLPNGVTYYKFENIIDNLDSEVYEYYENNVQVLEIFEGDKHEIIKVYPNGRLELNDKTIIEANEISTLATGDWYYVYRDSPIGGVDTDYLNPVTTNHNMPTYTESFIINNSVTALCSIGFRILFPKSSIAASAAVTLLVYAMGKIKTVADLAAGDITYLSYRQTKRTNNVVGTTLAHYYKYTFEFFAGPNCTNKIDMDGRNTTIFELEYFN